MRESLSDRSWPLEASLTMAPESTPAVAKAGSPAFPPGECAFELVFWCVPCGACRSNKRQPCVLLWLVQGSRQTPSHLCVPLFSVVIVAMAHCPVTGSDVFIFHWSLKRTLISQCGGWVIRPQA